MAFRDSYKGKENPGRWYPVLYDDERKVQVKLRIRRLPDHVRKQALQLYGVKTKDRRTRTHELVIPPTMRDVAGLHYAKYMLTDVMNCWVRVGDKEAADFYNAELGMKLRAGDDACLDGKMTDAIKEDMLSEDMGLVNFITEKGVLIEEDDLAETEEQEKELEGNSQASSSSSFPTSTSQKRSARTA